MMTLSGEANGPVHTRPEEFENGCSTLKLHQMFYSLNANGILKRNNHMPFWICVWGKLGREIIDYHCFRNSSFSKCFLFTQKWRGGVFKFLKFEACYQKAPFSLRISMDVGRPSRRVGGLQRSVERPEIHGIWLISSLGKTPRRLRKLIRIYSFIRIGK